MSNPVKRNTSGTETYSLNKGNLWFGVGGRDYGPTSETGFYLGGLPPEGGYVIYAGKTSGGQSNYFANNDSELITILSSITGNAFTSVSESLAWVSGQNDFAVINKSETELVTDQLTFAADFSSTLSYTTASTTLLDISENSRELNIINSPDFKTAEGWMDFSSDTAAHTTVDITYGNNTTWEALVKPTSDAAAYNMFMGRYLPYFGFRDSGGYKVLFSNRIASSQQSLYSNSSISLNTWYHLMFSTEYTSSNNSTTSKIYINGVEDNSFVRTGAQSNADGELQFNIGRWRESNSYNFDGSIQKARFYNKTFTPSDILQNYYGGPIVTDGLIFAIDANNLVSYESGSTTAYQLTGSNDGSLLNSTQYSSFTGGTWDFDGTDDEIRFTGTTILNDLGVTSGNDNDVAYSMEAWIYLENLPNGSGTGGDSIMGHNGSQGIGIQVFNIGGVAKINFGYRSNNNYDSNSSISLNEWHHIVGTREVGGYIRIYIDGVTDYEITGDNKVDYNTIDFGVGNSPGRIGPFDGKISTCRIYNKALSEEEVRQNYLAQWGRFT